MGPLQVEFSSFPLLLQKNGAQQTENPDISIQSFSKSCGIGESVRKRKIVQVNIPNQQNIQARILAFFFNQFLSPFTKQIRSSKAWVWNNAGVPHCYCAFPHWCPVMHMSNCPIHIPFLSLLLLSYNCGLPTCTAQLLCRRQDTAGRLVQSWSTIVGAGRRGTPASPDISGQPLLGLFIIFGLFVTFAMLIFDVPASLDISGQRGWRYLWWWLVWGA